MFHSSSSSSSKMSSIKKTITIDKANLQGLKNKNSKSKSSAGASTVKVKPFIKPNQFIQPNTLKRKLLARIKNHQQQKKNNNNKESNTETNISNTAENVTTRELPAAPNDSFAQSLEYLKSLAQNKQALKQKNKTQKKLTHLSQLSPQVFLNTFPSEPLPSSIVPSVGPSIVPPITSPSIVPSIGPSTVPSIASPSIVSPIGNSIVPSIASPSIVSPIGHSIGPSIGHSIGPSIVPSTVPSTVPSIVPSIVPDSSIVSPYIDEVPVQLNPEPQWGCLKGGAKPTFRTFHNKTCKTSHLDFSDTLDISNISGGSDTSNISNISGCPDGSDNVSEVTDISDVIASSELLYGGRKQRLDDYRKEQLKMEKQAIEPAVKIKQTKQKIITKKYKLGKYMNKNGPVIGVLIKNVQTQRNVEKKRNEMRHIPLDTIISRLHKKRLLKVGSTAPPDVLREMYESAVMAGDIENEGNDIALHNFLAGDTGGTTTDTDTI